MSGKLWTKTEEQYLRNNYNHKSISEISKELHRSYCSVQAKAQKLNLCTPKEGNRREWTQEEEDYLEKYYEKRGSDFIAKKFNRSKQSIKRKAQSIGVNAYVGTELYVKQISYAFNCDSRVINRWIDKLGLPCREFYRGQTKFRTIDVKKFWKWAENHKDIVPFNKYERYSLLPEPVWIRDAMKDNMNNNHRKSISSYDKMIVIRMKKDGKTFKEIATALNRTEHAVKHIWRSINGKEEH